MTFNERISKLIDLEGITRKGFEKSIGVSENYSYKMNNPSLDLLENILKVYTKINRNWLIFDEGEPYKKYETSENEVNIINEDKEKYETDNNLIKELKAENESNKIIIKSLIDRIKIIEEEAESLRQQKYGYRKNLTTKQFNAIHNKGKPDKICKRFPPQ